MNGGRKGLDLSESDLDILLTFDKDVCRALVQCLGCAPRGPVPRG
ncbi:hypothetical protein [Streptomyces sp. AK02-04a]|nr:hypothetical protein [Streptomyces sp. AK02-04a]MDX3755816.1 hypothetical protein [Streptomyces sp. AK02-04a]